MRAEPVFPVAETPSRTAVGSRNIGASEPCYLIAEVGTTSAGDIEKALSLIRAAADAGVDAVKFQVIDPDQVSDAKATYPVIVDGRERRMNMKEMFERLRFSEAQWHAVAQACGACGVDFFATVDYLEGVDMLETIGVPAHKIGAWDVTYRQLIERVGRTGKPMFVDLGPTTEPEIEQLVRWHRDAGGGDVLFLHDFHTTLDTQMNLRAISHLRLKFPWPVGFSSPGLDHDLDFAALALGASFVEKRLILDRSQVAFHAHESLEPDEFKAWVSRMRHVERALGDAVIRPSDKDLEGARLYYRSLCTLRDVRQGDPFDASNLGGKRPGTGMPTSMMSKVLGRRAKRDLRTDTLITGEDVE